MTSGDEIRVTFRDHQTRTGRLIAVDAVNLTLAETGIQKTVTLADVTAIDRRGDSLKNGVLLGLMIGAVTGLVLGTTFEGTESGETGRGAAGLLGGVFLGAGVGALADALRRGWTPVYRAPTKMPLSIVPMVGGGRFGVAVTVPIVRR